MVHARQEELGTEWHPMTSAGFKNLLICVPVSREEGIRFLGLGLSVLWVPGTGGADPLQEQLNL